MNKSFISLGLMSGTSMDGVDASIIKSNGLDEISVILNKYSPYDRKIRKNLYLLRDKINTSNDLKIFLEEIKSVEKEITLFHANFIDEIIKKLNIKIDLIGFHGHTIFHNASEKISKQIGDGELLSQLTKKKVIYDFRKNDLKNGGNGAPLSPIFHKILKKKIHGPVSFLNIGGITNETVINESNSLFAQDIGPGNCLIDQWIKLNSSEFFDNNGDIARSGKINQIILNQSLEIYFNNKISQNRSFDVKDFDISFVKGLSIEDGAATLTEYTSEILSKKILGKNIYACGGGRKNKFLIERIGQKINNKIKLIDDIKIDGDFVESQAFAYLAVRSYLNLPISFPKTTGCIEPSTGGIISKNF